jgi:hypothetical protein
MSGQSTKNKDLFTKYNIPFREYSKDQIAIDTAKVTYVVDLMPFKNNPFVFRVVNTNTNKTTVESKDTFLRRLCKHFKLDFIHWDIKKQHSESQYTKKVPEKIEIGGEYTTAWANPMAKWILSEITDDDLAILTSPKNKRKTLSKLSDLRIWVTKH